MQIQNMRFLPCNLLYPIKIICNLVSADMVLGKVPVILFTDKSSTANFEYEPKLLGMDEFSELLDNLISVRETKPLGNVPMVSNCYHVNAIQNNYVPVKRFEFIRNVFSKFRPLITGIEPKYPMHRFKSKKTNSMTSNITYQCIIIQHQAAQLNHGSKSRR